MQFRPFLPIALAGCLLAGCAHPVPIGNTPQQTILNTGAAVGGSTATGINSQVITGLQDSAYNFDNAMAIGALPANDPASNCVHGVLKQLGADVVVTPAGYTPVVLPNGQPATSFTPRVSDLISSGSVVYILAQQAKQLQAGGLGASVPMGCTALVGQIVIDAAKAGIKVGAGVFTGGLTSAILPALP